MRLTERRIAGLRHPGRYLDAYGLYLQIAPNGTKSWVLRYERDGKERMMGLGPEHTINLKLAREKAQAARLLLHDGKDPIDMRKDARAKTKSEAAKQITFEQAAERYFAAHEKKWRSAKHRAQYRSTLVRYVYPELGKLSVAAVDTGLILKVIEPIWQAKAETANRVRARIQAVLDWATAREFRVGENPARWRDHLDKLLPAQGEIAQVVHHAALPYDQISSFMAQLASRKGIAARALEFLILTAARTGEVIAARWPEFDLNAKLWIVPADRMKAGKEHRVPLSDRALATLASLPREGDFVFPGMREGSHISNMSMAVLLKRRMGRTEITVHGFRSSFRDWVAERTAFPSEVAEMALAHAVSDKTEAAYRRGDMFQKRRALAEAWASYCSAPAASTARVVSIRGNAK